MYISRLLIFFVLYLYLFISCEKGNGEIPSDDNDSQGTDTTSQVDYSDCTASFSSDSDIILDITASGEQLEFLMDDESVVCIPAKCIKSYHVDHVEWFVKVQYHDSTSQVIPFLGDSLGIDRDSIFLNPYGKAPLSAMVYFSTPFSRKIQVSVLSKSPNSADFTRLYDEYNTHHEIIVHGLYIDHNNTVVFNILDRAGNIRQTHQINIQTDDYNRPQSGEMTVIENNYSPDQKNRLFLIQNAIYDGAGDIRWYTTTSGTKFYRLANDLIGIQIYPDKGWIEEGPDIKIINFFGQTIETFEVPHRMHHEMSEKTPGGNLLVATNAEEYYTKADDTEDMIIEIDRQTDEIVKYWDLRDIFDPERERLWTENVNDWCHLNSIQYDSTDNTLLISSKLQYFISKIDYETGEIQWILGNHENWKEPWQKYLLTPINFETDHHEDQDWPYAQHMPRLTEHGTIIVYDNGGNRPGGDFTRAVEYKVDKENMTVEKIWSYRLDNVARSLGSIHMYDDKSVQIGHGGKGEIYEVSREGKLLFEAEMMNFYRAYAIQLY